MGFQKQPGLSAMLDGLVRMCTLGSWREGRPAAGEGFLTQPYPASQL